MNYFNIQGARTIGSKVRVLSIKTEDLLFLVPWYLVEGTKLSLQPKIAQNYTVNNLPQYSLCELILGKIYSAPPSGSVSRCVPLSFYLKLIILLCEVGH